MSHATRGAGEEDVQRPTVDKLLRISCDDARESGIALGARIHGALNDVVVDGVAEAVRRLAPIRGDPHQVRGSEPYGSRFAKRASELPRVHQLTPFVYRRLILEGLLPPPDLFIVRSADADLPPPRPGIAGRRPGITAIAASNSASALPEVGIGWSPIDSDHVIDLDHEWAGPEHGTIELPLTRLLEAVTVAHPSVPVVVDLLDWPVRRDGIVKYEPRFPDIPTQLWQHPAALLIFRSTAPANSLYFKPIPGSLHAPGLHFSSKEHIVSIETNIVSDRTIKFLDPYGQPHYFTIARNVTDAQAVTAIATTERRRNELMRYVDEFTASGALTGNAGSATATSVRAACVQITELLAYAGITRFDEGS